MKTRHLQKEQLRRILRDHQNWIESDGAEGTIADLDYANLEGADFGNLDLGFAKLRGANLKNSNLSCAQFEQAQFAKADLRHANLKEAKFIGSCLKDADIQDADFLGAEFAGADMTGAKLSEDKKDFKPLETVAEISINARKIFFVLLLACVYSWLTIATTLDVRLVTNSTSSPLPIIRTEIPIVSFYWAAPLILIGVYLYFHLYLQHLWTALALLPAKFPDGRTLDERSYPWLVKAIVRRHYLLLRQHRSPMARLEEYGTILLAWWMVPITLSGFWIRYLPRHEWNITMLHIVFLLITIAFTFIFYRSAANTMKHRRSNQPRRNNTAGANNLFSFACLCLIGILLFVVSYGAINGVRSKSVHAADINIAVPWILNKMGYDVFADFREIDVSAKPTDYWRIASQEDRLKSIKGASLKKADLRYADMFRAFLAKAILRNANLQGARLRKADLQNADIRGANLRGADLRGANLRGADLREAQLENADLVGANLQDANLGLALFEGANLKEVNLKDADLRCANLIGVENLVVEQLTLVRTLFDAKLGANILGAVEKRVPQLRNEPEEQWIDLNLEERCR